MVPGCSLFGALGVVILVGSEGIILAVISLLAAPFAAWITWILNRRKRKTDVSSSLVNASTAAVDALKDVLEELRIELADAKSEIEELKDINKRLEAAVEELTTQNKLLLRDRVENAKFARGYDIEDSN